MRQNQPLSARPPRMICTVLASVLLAGLAACEQPADEADPVAEPEPLPSAAPSLPAVLPGLSRADLIAAVNRAASDYAAGTVRADSDPLVGRTFAVTMAFGCGGPVAESADAAEQPGLPVALWDGEREAIALRLTPASWAESPVIAREGEESGWEAVEGFWLPRPWLTGNGCPAPRGGEAGADSVPASPQTLGIAAIFEEGGSRIGRRNGRPYAFTVRGERDEQLVAPPQGYRLVLEGRTVAFPDGRAVRCQSASADVRPVCVVASRLDRVAFETADGKLLSEWRSS
ncbi:hypothetical protein [Alteraurantiacibacter buctensis]|uniref:Lipoprotein n=1 Tax=Alteraurantiacibacter buctensis TaxID=1503981 RepID=A0A844YVI8_9SPHN|nr:hypothetical protein [Alteraurantiacibacter buctensis]MXO71066.1 hypothetical protein [Alteraurantiacibacter buctensis]